MEVVVKHLIITAHGIRTFGDWQERLESLLRLMKPTADERLEVFHYKYGWFSIIAFLVPFSRWLVVRRFRKELLRRANSDSWDRIDLVGHSFGSHLIGWGLYGIPSDKRPKVHTIILAGSVLKPTFPWLNLIGSSVRRLINECGLRDNVLLLNQIVVLFTGMAGRVGFAGMTGSTFRNRYFAFGHSGYFQTGSGPDDSFMSEKWIPLLIQDGPIAVFPDPRRSSAVRGVAAFVLNNLEPIKLVVYVSPLIWLFLFYRGLYLAEKSALAGKETEKKRAETALKETERTLSQSEFAKALQSLDEDKDLDALARLARSVVVDSSNRAAACRLISLLTYRNYATSVACLKHSDTVNSAQFGPNGKLVVTASGDKTACVWSVETGERIGEPLKHDGTVVSAEFSPSGLQVLTACGQAGTAETTAWGYARIWDAVSGKPLTDPLKHNDIVTAAHFSPDGKWVVTASADKTACVWDSRTGEPITKPIRHDDAVISAQFSPDGQRILTATLLVDFGLFGMPELSGTVRVCDASTGKPLTKAIKCNWSVSAQFSPDGKSIVIGSGPIIQVCNAQTGRPLFKPIRNDAVVNSVQFSSDGKQIVAASGSMARIWDAKQGKPLTEPMKHNADIVSVQFSSDGKQIVAASGKFARVWDAKRGKPVTELMRHDGLVTSAQFNRDGTQIVTSSDYNMAHLWCVKNGKALAEGIGNHVNSAEFSSDGKKIVTASGTILASRLFARGSDALSKPMLDVVGQFAEQYSKDSSTADITNDGAARVWDAETGKPLTDPMAHRQGVLSAEFSPDHLRIVTGSNDGTARVWDATTGKALTEPMKHDRGVHSAQFSPDSKRILTACGDHNKSGYARIWDALTGQALTEPMENGRAVCAALFSPDGKRIVTASEDFWTQVWDTQTGKAITKSLKNHNDVRAFPVASAQFSPDSRQIVASDGTAAQIWDAQSGKLLIEPVGNGVVSVNFSPNGEQIVTGSDQGDVRIWDVRAGRPLTAPMKHDQRVDSAEYSPDGKLIVTASDNSDRHQAYARIWDVQTGKVLSDIRISDHDHDFVSAQFSPDGERILTTCGVAQVWYVMPAAKNSPQWLATLAEAIAGQRLNDHGFFEPLSKDAAELLKEISDLLNRESSDDNWVVWGRWFLADRSSRTASPSSKVTVPEYIENRITENTTKSLDEAEQLAIGNPQLLQRVQQARERPTAGDEQLVTAGPHKRTNPGGQRRMKSISRHERSTPRPRR